MSVTSVALDSELKLKFQVGLDGEGNPIAKRKTISKIKSSAKDEELVEFVNIIEGLQKNTILEIERENSTDLEEE